MLILHFYRIYVLYIYKKYLNYKTLNILKMEIVPEKKKRGRKAKILTVESQEIVEPIIKYPKKRGRKPKGGKVVSCLPNTEIVTDSKINIILHLKCGLNDITNKTNNLENNNINNFLENYKFSESKLNDLNYTIYNSKNINADNKDNASIIDNIDNIHNNTTNITFDNTSDNTNNVNHLDNIKTTWQKLDELSNNLHLNNICDKKSACFHCTYEFDNVPIYIPKHELKETYYVYGCFCSPECACAYLMNEKNIDSSTRFERYHLLNFLYCKIYNYSKNIKPAPSPYYTLDKYYGNLSIQEYRKLLKNERLLLVVDKPLIRVLPELHQDSDDYLLNSQGIPSGINKYTLRKHEKLQSKNDILNQQFNLK